MKVLNIMYRTTAVIRRADLSKKTPLVVFFLLLSPALLAKDYLFELGVSAKQESAAGASSSDIYGIDAKYLFNLGGKHKPKYDILAEHEFFAKKSYVRLSYQNQEIKFKNDSSRYRSRFRALDSFLRQPASDQIRRARDTGLSQARDAIAAQDYSATAAALAGPGPGIPGLTAEQVEAALNDLVAPDFLAADVLVPTFAVTRDSSNFELETLGLLDAQFVFLNRFIVGIGYQRVVAPGYEKNYELTSDESISIERLGIADGALTLSEQDVGELEFDFDPELVISSDVDLTIREVIDIDQDIFNFGAGIYLNDSSALMFNYERSETDAEIDGYRGDYDEYELRYKLAARLPESNNIAVLDISAAHRAGLQSANNLNRVSFDGDYYFNKRISLGGSFEMDVAKEAENVIGYSIDAQFFITQKMAINVGFAMKSIFDEQDDDADIPRREIFSLSFKGRI